MNSGSLVVRRPEDCLAHALPSAFAAAMAMLAVLVLVYGLTAFLAHPNPLIDRGRGVAYLLASAQVGLALVGGLAYALAHRDGHASRAWRGILLAVPLWLVDGVALLPQAGAGLFGTQHGAGPLLAAGTLLAYLVFGATMGAVYGPAGDRLLGPATEEEALAMQRSNWGGAGGLALGALVGAVVGIFVVPALVPASAQLVLRLPPAGLALAFTLLGGAFGMLVGILAGLGAPAAAEAPVVAPAVAAAAPAVATPSKARAGLGLPRLKVVASSGFCLQGYKPGDIFASDANGELSPALCPAATEALRPAVVAMARRDPAAPRSVACPIVEHMLVFELAPAAA